MGDSVHPAETRELVEAARWLVRWHHNTRITTGKFDRITPEGQAAILEDVGKLLSILRPASVAEGEREPVAYVIEVTPTDGPPRLLSGPWYYHPGELTMAERAAQSFRTQGYTDVRLVPLYAARAPTEREPGKLYWPTDPHWPCPTCGHVAVPAEPQQAEAEGSERDG